MNRNPRWTGSIGAGRRGGLARRVMSAGAVLLAVSVGSVGSVDTASAAVVPSLGYDPADLGSLSSVAQIIGVPAVWAQGYTGAGVDVAVIDTGVAPVPGLDGPGKVITGPDLSLDATGARVPGLDGYGHGTFMAGLIAAKDAGATAPYTDTSQYVGIAPDARIVNVKVGAADGAVDVTQVIAAIDWVTQHAHDPGLNIKVISLSYGTDSTQAYTIDPLAQAAEQAWKHGIVVVAAAGNDGKKAKTLASPAYDPYVIAAGADDPVGTLDSTDDVVPDFAQHGTTKRPVDVTAPATHTLGLRVPGSYIDVMDGNVGRVGERFQRGSGTSQAAAIVAGVAALLVQKYPTATPDTIKSMLNGTATGLKNSKAKGQLVHWGHGIVNAHSALAATPTPVTQTWTPSTGTGTLDASRGTGTLTSGGIELTGQQDIFGQPFNAAAIAAAQKAATAWNGGIWNGSRWTGDDWTGSRWTSTDWEGSDWTGNRWTGSRWTGQEWTGSRWTGSRWTGDNWTGDNWTGSRWSDATLN